MNHTKKHRSINVNHFLQLVLVFIVTTLFFYSLFGLWHGAKKPLLRQIMFFGIGHMALFAVLPFSHAWYFLPVIPFTSIIAAYGMYHLTKKRNFLLIILLAITILPPIVGVYIRRMVLSPIDKQLEKPVF